MALVAVLIILALDRLTKILATSSLTLNKSVPVIKGIFHFTLVYNRGAAFGILRNQLSILIATSLIAVVLIYRNLKKNEADKSFSFALSLILAGALGNLIDRLIFGYVIDFLDFRIWPVFNVADSAITVGAVLLGWSLLKSQRGNHVP